MGVFVSQPQFQVSLSTDSLLKAVDTIKKTFSLPNTTTDSEELYQAIATINADFVKGNVYEVRENGETFINPNLLKLWFQCGIESTCQGLYEYWRRMLEEISKARNVMIKIKTWRMLRELTDLLICLSSDRLFYILNNLGVLNLCDQSRQTAGSVSTSFEDDLKETFLAKLNKEEAEGLYKCLLIVLSNFLGLKTAALTRSEETMQEISRFAEGCFAIFCRAYFNPLSYSDLQKRAIKVNNETNLEICSYFLASSLESRNSSLFDISILFGISLVHTNQTNPQVNSLPSHLFKSLPTLHNNNIYDFIFQTCLFALTYRKQGSTYIPKIQIIRINALRLLYYLAEYHLITFSTLSTTYLQNIVIHTKVEHIERIFLSHLISNSLKVTQTEALKKYSLLFQKPFEIALSNVQLKYQVSDLLKQAISNEEYLVEEMAVYYYDYLMETVLHRPRVLGSEEKKFWSRLLDSKRDNRVTC